MLRVGDQLGGAYSLLAPLHEGEISDYWLARHREGHRAVLNVLRPAYFDDEMRPLVLDRLEERRAVRHPRIPALLEHFTADVDQHERCVAVFPYVPGVSCEALLQDEEVGLPFVVACRVVERLARTIQEARISPGWVSWCCLHPGGVIIDPGGQVWWLLTPRIDAVSSALADIDLVRTRGPRYMAPEVITGEAQLPQSTVFSLGVLLFELLTGVHPFRGDTLFQTLMNIRGGARPRLSEHVEAPLALERVVDQALSPDFSDRTPLPRTLADELDRALVPYDSGRSLADYVLLRRPELLGDDAATEPALPATDLAPRTELLAEIARDRTAPEPYLVYADWLQARGEPRGELIVVHHELERTTDETRRAALEAEARRLLSSHPELLGDLAEALMRSDASSPFFDAHPHFLGPPGHGPLALEWYLGFIRAARIAVAPPEGVDVVRQTLRRLEQEESAQLLSELTIGFVLGPTSSRLDMDGIYEALASSRLDVSSLFLGDLSRSTPRSEHRGIGNICAVFPHLRRLALRGGPLRMGQLALPELRELRIFSSGLQANTLSQLASSKLHALRLLELWFGGAPQRDAWPDRVGLLFEEDALPSLEHLALCDRQHGALAATLAVLAESPLAPRLLELDIHNSAGVEPAVRAMLTRADRFERLEALVVGPGSADNLRSEVSARWPHVTLGPVQE